MNASEINRMRIDNGLRPIPLDARAKRKAIESIPREDWPFWAKALEKLSASEDKGIGDVVARTIGTENSEAFKRWFKLTFGKPCGCNGREKLWNIKYPLNLKAT